MYCVIQEITRKKIRGDGEPLRIEPYETKYSIKGQQYITYGYSMSQERCSRSIYKAYKISIHRSFRIDGKVKKQQVSICTMGYYDIADTTTWVGDYMRSNEWTEKQQKLGVSEEELANIIYEKLDPLIEQIKDEFNASEEGRLKAEHRKIIEKYNLAIDEFTKKYDCERDEFKYCYDIFLNLKNPEYLKKIQQGYADRQEYYRQYQKSSSGYGKYFYGNYNSSSYSDLPGSNYTKNNKDILKQFYRVLSKKFHPDANVEVDTSEHMKVLNQLKQEWGV